MDLNDNSNEDFEVGDANENFHEELMKFEDDDDDSEDRNDDTEDEKKE